MDEDLEQQYLEIIYKKNQEILALQKELDSLRRTYCSPIGDLDGPMIPILRDD